MFHDFPWFPHVFPMIFHEMLNISIQIYVLGPSQILALRLPGNFLVGQEHDSARSLHLIKMVDCAATTATTATRFNKHGEFTEVHSCLKLGAEQTNFNICHGVSMSWFLRTNRQQKIGRSPRDPSGPFTHAAWPSGDEAVQPNPQSTRFKNVATMVIQVVDRNKGPIRAFSGNNGPLGSSLSVPSEAICPEKILQLGHASLSGVFCWECLSIHVVL